MSDTLQPYTIVDPFHGMGAHVYYLKTEVDIALREAKLEGMEEAARIADNDSELLGPISMPVLIALTSLTIIEQQRCAVRATKKSIAGTIRSRIDALRKAQHGRV